MIQPRLARAAAGAACCAIACAVAGCASTASSSTASVAVTGNTLSIYLSEPPGQVDAAQQDVLDAEQLAFAQGEQKAAKKTGFRLVDHVVQDKELSDNARAAIEDQSTIAYLGEIAPGASEQTVGITNAQDILQLSPTDTALELNTKTSAVHGAPNLFYESLPSYGRTFARMVPDSAVEATAIATAMKSRYKVTSLAIGSDGSDYGNALKVALSAAASSAGITVESSISQAGAYFYASNSASAFKKFSAVASQHAGIKLFGPSALDTAGFLSHASSFAAHLYISVPVPAATHAAAVRRFDAEFTAKYGHTPAPQAVFGYAAMQALLQTLKSAGSSANDRATVVKDFLDTKDGSSVLGTYTMDMAGNITSGTTFELFRASALTRG